MTQIGEGVAVAVPTPTAPTRHARLEVAEVAFKDNHPIDRDTLGPFPGPDWQRGRDATQQAPACYTRDTRVKVQATFRVTSAPSAAETVRVRGKASIGSTTLQWEGDITVSSGDATVTSPVLTSTAKLPNQVECVEGVQIEWEANPEGTGWGGAGSSEHVFYVLLGDPAGTPAFWTLVDTSCRAAAGESSVGGTVARTFDPFLTRAMTRRRDGRPLTYWNPTTTTVTNTRELLASGDGSGQCGSWSEFLIDMYRVHGITDGEKVLIVRTVADWHSSRSGFLVKNWLFGPRGSLPQPFTHEMGTECVELPGIPGQTNPNPPPAFYNHFIVRHGGQFYDPSYGGGPTATQDLWENGAIDGLFRGQGAGFEKSRNAATRLVEFYSMTTRQRI